MLVLAGVAGTGHRHPLPMPRVVHHGYWGAPTSPINWCETDYRYSHYVAEWYNTLTNGFYVLAALACFARAHRHRLGVLSWYYATMLLMTGLTSAYFHASLQWVGQKLDESFENATLITLLYLQPQPPKESAGGGRGLLQTLLHSSFAALGIFLIRHLFAEIHLVVTILLVVWRFHNILLEREKLSSSSSGVRLLLLRTALYGITGFACWLVDQVGCDGLGLRGAAWNPQLHGYWHLWTSMALHDAGVLAAWYNLGGWVGVRGWWWGWIPLAELDDEGRVSVEARNQ